MTILKMENKFQLRQDASLFLLAKKKSLFSVFIYHNYVYN